MLAKLLPENLSYRKMAPLLNKKAHSAVADEVNANGGRNGYDAEQAHAAALRRQAEKGKRTKLEISPGLKRYVIAKLREDWSPEQIAGELRRLAERKRPIISHETIYLFIYSEEGRGLKLWQHLRHRKKPERQHWGARRKRKPLIPERVSVHARPEHVDRREEFGHWEGDLMVFSESGKALAVFVERLTRQTIAVVNDNKTASEMELALHEMIASAGQASVLSVTFDNGLENVCHQQVREAYEYCFSTYFCDPYASWQKGTVENTNKLLRQYFPRDIAPEKITQDFADEVVKKLNRRPRKCLGYQTPSEKFDFVRFNA